MITALFIQHAGRYGSVEVSGHAGYADKGADIVCAAVTSSLELVCNTITEVLGVQADVSVQENRISLTLDASAGLAAQQLLEGLYVHLRLLSEQYPAHVRVQVRESRTTIK